MLMQSLKSFFMRTHFDHEDPDIDIYKYHPQLPVFLILNGIFIKNADSILRFVYPILGLFIALAAGGFEIMFIYHGYVTKDYSFATESFSYFIVVTTVPFVDACILSNRAKIMYLLDAMNKDFLYICRLEPKYKVTFLRGQLRIWQLCIVWFGIIVFVVSWFLMSTLYTLLYQSLIATQHEQMIRPLVFPIWLPEDDPYRTPNYEIFMAMELLICVIIPLSFGAYVYMLFHLLLHYFYIMEMIKLDFEVIFDGLDESVIALPRQDVRRVEVQTILNSRMRRIVKWQISVFKSVDNISSIFGSTLVYQILFSSVAICLMAYQIADYMDRGKFHYLFSMLCVATLLQLGIPCYLGTLIRNQAFSVGEACWSCGWQATALGRLLRQDISIFIMRAQKPVYINFTGLASIELETFSSIISTSYSYFNLLRQYK